MTLDLSLDAGQEALAAAVAGFCAEQCDDERVKGLRGDFPRELWRALAELGVFELASGLAVGQRSDGSADAGAVELVAVVEALGRAAFPGPLAATFLAMQLLDEKERSPVAAGDRIVCAGEPPLLPFAPCADVFLEIAGDRVFLARATGSVEEVSVLGGEPWGRVELERIRELEGGPRALLVLQLVTGAQLAALGQRLVDDAAAHAADRRQFGTPIGDFQAVAHPLADCAIGLSSSGTLVRAAAARLDDASEPGDEEAARFLAASALLSARRTAVEAAHACHQVFGAIGITLEGPVFHLSRRILQLAAQPPGADPARETVLRHAGLFIEGET